MGSTTILRGFKISAAVLDTFLAANNVYEIYGTPPFYKDHPDDDRISVLLPAKIAKEDKDADKNKFRVMIPSLRGSARSEVAYVTYTWVTVLAHRELAMDEDLPAKVPLGFEGLRQEILSFRDTVPDGHQILDEGHMGLYVVYTHDIRGLYMPQELLDRDKVCPALHSCS